MEGSDESRVSLHGPRKRILIATLDLGVPVSEAVLSTIATETNFMMLSSLISGDPVTTSVIYFCMTCGTIYYLLYHFRLRRLKQIIPVSVNYHFSRRCNYECGFCFHTEKTSRILPLDKAKRGMKLLKEAGMRKLNFAGGEPFLYPKFMQELLRYGKTDLEIESISIVSNGSKITERFLRENAAFIDILAISCDSFEPETNIRIGRGKDGKNMEQLKKIAAWCRQFNIKFKVNTVICSLNWEEDMAPSIEQIRPFRWKVFQCLIVTGENDNGQRKRDARQFLISDEQWDTFCNRHKGLKCFVPESNELMKGSYLILDEDMRFLDKGDGQETASESILNIGVEKAMAQVRWEQSAFLKRGGLYDWGKDSSARCASDDMLKKLEW